jgi:tRNA nucleotidyltransferase (CCA-adding enzyme)
MKTWMVGGAVRDALLGLPVHDRDWVVVGATPQALMALGYIAVGKDFPVYLHPETREEVALARTEKKVAKGYHGFTFQTDASVTLEDDLKRRDLTINAMAQDEDGTLVDPYGGQHDLQARVLRHVSDAFAQDPVRILRLARFAARFTDFVVASETLQLMQHMVQAGEVDALVSERVWQELSRGLMQAKPSRFFEVLRSCGALARLLPEVDCLWGVPQPAAHHPEIDTGVHLMMVLDMAAQLQAPLPVRYACLGHDLGKGTTPAHVLPRHTGHEERSVKLVRSMSERLRVPLQCRQLAELVAREHGHVHRCLSLSPAATVRLLDRCDAWRKPQQFQALLLACECDARGRLGSQEQPYPQATHLSQALAQAQTVDTTAIAERAAARGKAGSAIGAAIHAARVESIDLGRLQDASS